MCRSACNSEWVQDPTHLFQFFFPLPLVAIYSPFLFSRFFILSWFPVLSHLLVGSFVCAYPFGRVSWPPSWKIHHKYSKEFLFTRANRCSGHFTNSEMRLRRSRFAFPFIFTIFSLSFLVSHVVCAHTNRRADVRAEKKTEKKQFPLKIKLCN